MESLKADEVKLNQDLWLIQIKEGLQLQSEKEEEMDIRVSVYGVPNELLTVKPEAYIPQCVSIGPYHHRRSQLCEMERYKVAAAQIFQKTITGKFEDVVEEVKKYDWQIRNCYHKYLDYKKETLAWLMALDASFALDCLQFQVQQADQASLRLSSHVKRLGRVLDPSGRSAIHNAIMRDLMMLENQLPLFILQKLLEMELGSQDRAEERICNLLTLACKQWSPFMLKMQDSSRLRIKERGHILEVLYYSIVPAPAMEDSISKKNENGNVPLADSTYLMRALKAIWKALSSIQIGLVELVSALSERVLKERPVQLVTQLSKNLVSAFETLSIKRRDETDDEKDEETGFPSAETPPTRDELAIPSVSDLYSAGVKFLPTEGDLTTIRFDPNTATLYLPKVRLDCNTEVVLRNLVAFEASAAPGALIFTRYTDFMNGIIDTVEDVGLLRKSGIIYSHLADDGKVASLWNGLGKCVKLTKVQHLDQVIADVNKHYHKRWSVAVKEKINRYIFGSWRLLTVVAAGILLLLTCLEAFCSVYECKHWWSDTSLLQD
ncbi:hypothetical protein SUGI_0720040 [Cryptomeria japonica]|uniref:putative UPF0481 protein At3g02645 n=1 Tax=Cryptomeria japonica TaxID=3369 RepID=UPI00241499AB|nr:putative UPF0481 protein At3g02645 [Cryptomeria japonica]GLJ35876.1 hypothetical protein SUGI_0720040 [Cryptomeria japonica]